MPWGRARRLALRNHSWGCCVNARRPTARYVFYDGCDCFCWRSGYQVPQIFSDYSNSIFPIRLLILLACHLVALRVFSNACVTIEQKCRCILLKRIIGNLGQSWESQNTCHPYDQDASDFVSSSVAPDCLLEGLLGQWFPGWSPGRASGR